MGWREGVYSTKSGGKGRERERSRERMNEQWLKTSLRPSRDLPGCKVKQAPINGSWGKKPAGLSILVGGRLDRPWKLLQGLYWAAVSLVDLYTHLTICKSLYRVLYRVQSQESSRWS